MNKKRVFLMSLLSLCVLLVFVGASYAFFIYYKEGQKNNQLTTGNFQVTFQEESGAIVLRNAYPMKDEEGIALDPYIFSVENKGNIAAKYQISIVEDESNTLNRSNLRYELKKQGEEGTISNLDDLVIKDNITLEGLQKDTYELRIWLDENTGNEAMGKTWKGKVQVVAEESKAYAFEDYIAPTIKLNGERVMTIEKGGNFEDPGVESVSDNVDSLSISQVTKRYEYFDGIKTQEATEVNTNNEGVYVIYYELLDSRGNKGVAARTVNVVQVNSNPPVVTLNGEQEVSIYAGDDYQDEGTQVVDELGETLPVLTFGSYNKESIGDYIIKYFAIDKDGNIGSNTRIIHVEAYEDITGANRPELAEGLIPVYYDKDNQVWKKANKYGKWYDYGEQMWANAVTVKEEGKQTRSYYQQASSGTAIDMEDINTMWVWIPRYEYRYDNLGNQYAGGTQAQPGAIGINFLNGTSESTSINYMLHPAFTFGEEKLTGFWYGKFELSTEEKCTGSACNNETFTINVKPNVNAWEYASVSTMFYVSRAMQTNNYQKYGFANDSSYDIHIIKNSEWGAVAYLSQSIYGKYGNPDYTGVNKEVYQNKSSSLVTGSSNGTPSQAEYRGEGQCAYDDMTYLGEGKGWCGPGASTTGTIYGVYDMSGGANEYVMGVAKDEDGKPRSGKGKDDSGFNGKILDGSYVTNGRPFPELKYYQTYNVNQTADIENNDLTSWCDTGICYGDAISETSGWYGDYVATISLSHSWLARGQYFDTPSYAGVFNSLNPYGNGWTYYSSRIVLVP